MKHPITVDGIAVESDYQNGLLCSWFSVPTTRMTKAQLIAFVGQLDTYINRPLQTPTDGEPTNA